MVLEEVEMTLSYNRRKKTIRKEKFWEEMVWEAKMLGKYAPCEGESMQEAYERTYNKNGTFIIGT